MSAEPRTAKVWTYEDLFTRPDDGRRWEIIEGELYELPKTYVVEAAVKMNVVATVIGHLDRTGIGGRVLMAPWDVRLGRSVVQPDVLYFAAARWAARRRARAAEDVPDLVVEILSPDTRAHDEHTKLAVYAAAGVPEYWLIDPERRTIRVLAVEDGAYAPVEPTAEGVPSRIVPGLVLTPEAVFAGID